MSLVSVARCRVEVSARGRPIVQRSPIECALSKCDLYTVHSSTATAGSTLFTAILSSDTIHYPKTGEADPGDRAV